MANDSTEVLRGTLDLLVLKALSLQPLHGLGVARRINQVTGGTFNVKPGSLFPALHRMEQKGWIEGTWGESKNNRRAKFYELTAAGKRQLGEEKANWTQVVTAIEKMLEST